MKRFVFAVAMAMASVHAFACPLTQSLAEHYGISFSGFKTSLPEAKGPDTDSGDSFVRVVISDHTHVSDGFRHTVVMDTKTKKVWILRTSGFLSAYQWFGPVDAIDSSLTNCRLEPMPAVLKSESQESK